MSEFITNAELRIEAERLCDENDQLREENAKLRDVESENASLRGAVQGLVELCDKYRAENDKLREFATLAWQIMIRNEPMHVWQDMVNDARKLGIEVDDD